jgi:hypothetical protein
MFHSGQEYQHMPAPRPKKVEEIHEKVVEHTDQTVHILSGGTAVRPGRYSSI